jgi:hypothetical protein
MYISRNRRACYKQPVVRVAAKARGKATALIAGTSQLTLEELSWRPYGYPGPGRMYSSLPANPALLRGPPVICLAAKVVEPEDGHADSSAGTSRPRSSGGGPYGYPSPGKGILPHRY